MYHEDVDLSVRLRMAGGTVGIEPTAVVAHDYDFSASPDKWRWLERNRLAFLVRTYPGPLLALLAPALLATELALLPVAAAGGWGRQKLRANREFASWLPRLLRERRALQRQRAVSAAEFASWLTPDLDSDLISPLVRSWPARLLLRGYWRLVRALVSSTG
jgi:GT2 family glycosyltransferase